MFTKEDWNAYARHYDVLCSLRPYTEMLNKVAAYLPTGTNAPILDASCGTGNLPLTLSQVSSRQVRVHGIDRAGPMLDLARRKCSAYPHYTFEEGDLDAPLRFADESFSCVASINTLYAVKNPSRTLSEFHRVLCYGGTIVVVVPTRNYENGMILKAHCGSKKPDSYWSNLHESAEREEMLIREAVTGDDIIASLVTVARMNREIAQTATFHFFDLHELHTTLDDVGFTVMYEGLTYAQQDSFIVAQKGESK